MAINSEDFEEPVREPILSVEKAKEYAADTAKVATAVEQLFGSDGWKIFMARFERTRAEVEAKDDYASIEDFRSDRRALKIVDDLIAELGTYIDDASRALDLFTSLTAEDQTPRSAVSLSTGEKVEA